MCLRWDTAAGKSLCLKIVPDEVLFQDVLPHHMHTMVLEIQNHSKRTRVCLPCVSCEPISVSHGVWRIVIASSPQAYRVHACVVCGKGATCFVCVCLSVAVGESSG
jgi:hypothetical protein